MMLIVVDQISILVPKNTTQFFNFALKVICFIRNVFNGFGNVVIVASYHQTD